MTDDSTRSFPRLNARTDGFTRGAPRSLQLDPTGSRLTFVRSEHGTDPVGALWSLDVATGTETLVADPRAMLGGGAEQLSRAEQARRERSRDGAAGIVGYATDRDATVAAFALSSRLWLADLGTGPAVRELPAVGAGHDPPPPPPRPGGADAPARGGDGVGGARAPPGPPAAAA
jgi:dipeptidyl-peptidase-4